MCERGSVGKVTRKDPSEAVTFQLRPEQAEGAQPWAKQGRTISGKVNTKVQINMFTGRRESKCKGFMGRRKFELRCCGGGGEKRWMQ